MKGQVSAVRLLLGAALVTLLAATPAFAQFGAITGRIVDESGAPVPDAEIKIIYTGESPASNQTGKTDRNGRFTQGGLTISGTWSVVASKDGMSATLAGIQVKNRDSLELPDIQLIKGAVSPPVGTPEENAARAKEAAAMKALLDAVNAALDANDTPTAIARLTEAAATFKACVACYLRLGGLYEKTNEPAKAEEAYKAAIAIDDESAEAWEALAVFYNGQRRFDDAAAATSKMIAAQATAGGGDATSAYNAGVILSNQRKMPEARAQFQRAVQLDPKMADAHYQLAMTLLNEGNFPDAVKSLEAFLALNPTGPNADAAKGMLPEIKNLIK